MQSQKLIHILEEEFGRKIKAAAEEGPFPFVLIDSKDLLGVLQHVMEKPEFRFDFLECLTGLDTGQELFLIYQLYSTALNHKLNIKLRLDRQDAEVPTVTHLWRAAFYYELEVMEMLGVKFKGHSRAESAHLFLANGWQGHPLLKDYSYPETIGEIEHRRAPLRKDHVRP